ncbi:NAD(P)-dependent dehydrogenase (short-subunit alcohol dehydrogenase family) [Kribbella orskensis]|uniref:NAD(P)-dependent dehydrogenase (Short-subunit alcohol dehydrogenase family) n=1 Tax=Kribbella orskensis TaxID=2512216 RepID=A0ABY2BAU1_9ACTN|nr:MULTISPECIES: SDR family oxidoreductase [Kribbella]TCN33589.1 NAD(P)-dependent dehydrogenase (short-subunit alcohol dehydrogenase family) [Kribbella sp. VKM Ac-2500]TCO14004.1 NAD(P)-dependent dehydrogenase (short-subunit alcohol dehydrogenase family) [Kribbella orskensis]
MQKVAVVTGGGSGLGREMALALAAVGFQVTVTGRTETRLRETAAAAEGVAGVGAAGVGEVRTAVLDVADGSAVSAFFQSLDRIDLLVNNAGTGSPAAAVQDVTDEDWRQVIDTNLTGSFLCAREAFALMLRQDPKGGRIINNGSISAHVPRPHGIAYTASKHAISGLTKGLELEGRAHGITCGQIDIGNAATSMTARMSQGVLQPDGSTAVEPTFDPRVVADFVVQIAQLPTTVAVPTLTVMAAGMPYAGRG